MASRSLRHFIFIMLTLQPDSIGIGLRARHYDEVLSERPELGFVELHSENFFHAGGAAMRVLERACESYPLSLHGVGLSLASADELSQMHLDKLAALVARVEPALVSEHLCWGALQGVHFNDLLPFPYTEEALHLMCERVDRVQTRLGRRILIENLSAYVQFAASEMSECAFINELATRTGCGILLDVNNLYVNAVNFGFDAREQLALISARHVGEIHLAGFTEAEHCLIDTHGSRVVPEVWSLYRDALAHCGPVPTLIEWDTDVPELAVLLDEVALARGVQMTLQEAQHV